MTIMLVSSVSSTNTQGIFKSLFDCKYSACYCHGPLATQGVHQIFAQSQRTDGYTPPDGFIHRLDDSKPIKMG